VARDTALNAPQPPAGAATNTPNVRAPNSAASQGAAAFGANASPAPSSAATIADDAQKRVDQATAGPSGPTGAALAPQETGRLASSAPERPQVLNPWLWLTLAIISGAAAIALHRRLRASV
jgi:hypothetical protein